MGWGSSAFTLHHVASLIPWRKPKAEIVQQSRTVFSGEVGAGGLRFGGLNAADALLEQIAGFSSERISRRDALKAMAVLRARNLIAGVCATLPIELRNGKRELDDRNWIGVQPNDKIEDTVTYANTFEDLLFEGKSYWRVTRRGFDGFPLEGEHLNHRAVTEGSTVLEQSRLISEDLQFTPDAPIYVDGVYDPRAIRFVSPNPPMLVHAARAIRTILLLDRIASTYADNPLPFGYFTDSADEDALEDEEIQAKLNQWERARRDRVWGYVEKGLELNTLDWPTPQQLQLVEARNHAVLDISRAAGLDPEDLSSVVEGTSRTYQNSEQRRLDLIDFTLMPYLSAVQDRLSMNDIVPRGVFAKFRVGAFARADTKSRFEAYKIGLECKFMTIDEVRRMEDWPDLTAAQKRELAEAAKAAIPPQLRPAAQNGNGDKPIPPSNGNGRSPVGADDVNPN